jgi:DNA-binding response OmpR family regulator
LFSRLPTLTWQNSVLQNPQLVKPKNLESRRRVLLVEDHALLAEATAEFMQSKGFDVRIASTGREALETATAFHPEIVLCDVRLPDMSGLDVVRALREVPGAKDAVIAMHSAMTDRDLDMQSLQTVTAVNLFLSKPLTEEKLNALLSVLKSRAKKDSDMLKSGTLKRNGAKGSQKPL